MQLMCHNGGVGKGVSLKHVTFLALLLMQSFLFAENWTVDDDGKADFNRIQDAIDAASNLDIIDVMPGIYNEVINFNGKSIVVQGQDAKTTIIDGSGLNQSVVTFQSGETTQSVLSRFTIRGGSGTIWDDPIFGPLPCGGGIYVENASPMIQLCSVEENTAWGGGGIFLSNASPFIMFTDVVMNSASGHGGGLYLNGNVDALIDSLQITDNTASWGGGMTCMANSNPQMLNCSFDYNRVENVGGGLYIRSSSSPQILACTFNYNEQTTNPLGSGGGICIYGGGNGGGPCYPFIRLCHVIGNSVSGDGGGIAAAYDAHPKIRESLIAGNTAGRSGGGLAVVADIDYLYPCIADVFDVDIEDNTAIESGGGIHVRWSEPIIEAVNVNGNSASVSAGGINFFESPDSSLTGSSICSNAPSQVEGSYIDGTNNFISDNCTCFGDVNQDGDVNVSDILLIVSHWGPCSGDCPTDVNFDNYTNVTDLLLTVGQWGPCE